MSDLPAPVARAIDAASAGDTDAFLSCFTAGGVVDDWGRAFQGADAIRAWSDHEFIGVKVSLDVTCVEQLPGARFVPLEDPCPTFFTGVVTRRNDDHFPTSSFLRELSRSVAPTPPVPASVRPLSVVAG